MSELNSKEVAEYLLSLFRKVYPRRIFRAHCDSIRWEVWVNGKAENFCIIAAHSIYYYKNGNMRPHWWVYDASFSTIDFNDEESIIALIKTLRL